MIFKSFAHRYRAIFSALIFSMLDMVALWLFQLFIILSIVWLCPVFCYFSDRSLIGLFHLNSFCHFLVMKISTFKYSDILFCWYEGFIIVIGLLMTFFMNVIGQVYFNHFIKMLHSCLFIVVHYFWLFMLLFRGFITHFWLWVNMICD